MPNWTDHPPADPSTVSLPLRRTPPAGPIAVLITTPNLLGCHTHFYGGRTVPCEQPDCDACRRGVPYRWHAYIGGVDLRWGNQIILELTAGACDNLVAYLAAHGTLRGCRLEATRVAGRRNGRIATRCTPHDLNGRALPAAPDLKAALALIWGLPEQSLSRDPTSRTWPTVQVDHDQAHPLP